MWPSPQFSAGLVTFIEKILNGKLHFLFSGGTLISAIEIKFSLLLNI